jgi:hypothetical protein
MPERLAELHRRKRYRIGYAAQGQRTSFPREVLAGLQRAAEQQQIELLVLDNRYQPKVALRNADQFIREQVDLVIEFQTDESVAPAIASKYLARKNSHTLANRRSVSLAPGSNAVAFGTLREGDANDDNCVTIADFAVLANGFFPNYDPRTDFNQDGYVNTLDFSMLRENFGVCGDSVAARVSDGPSR